MILNKVFATAINCSRIIHNWFLFSQLQCLEVDNTFGYVGSFANNRDCGGLFLYMINTVIKPT